METQDTSDFLLNSGGALCRGRMRNSKPVPYLLAPSVCFGIACFQKRHGLRRRASLHHPGGGARNEAAIFRKWKPAFHRSGN